MQTVKITKDLTIEGGYDSSNWAAAPDPIAHPTTLDAGLDAGGLGRVVYVAYSVTATLRGLVIQGGYNHTQYWQDARGAGIYNDGTLTVDRCTIRNSVADGYGGGIYNDYAPDGCPQPDCR